ncbi:MAG: carboxypeptidase-like regulatory domain-containing protein [Bryobacteraceae bacterium]
MRTRITRVIFRGLAGLLLARFYAPAQPGAQQGVMVSGTVVNSVTGEPVRRAEVKLTRMDEGSGPGGGAGASLSIRAGGMTSQSPGDARQQPLSAVTGSDGSFRFENIPEGEYEVFVRREGMFPRSGAGLSPQRIRATASEPVTGLRYALAPQAVLSGRVIDEEGEPLQGIQVTVLRRSTILNGTATLTPYGASMQTDDRGAFRLYNLPAGKYLIVARPSQPGRVVTEGAGGTHAPTYYPDALEPDQAAWIQVAAGQEAANLELRLRRVPSRKISGRVLLEDGSPAQDFTLTQAWRGHQSMPMFPSRMERGREPGSFTLSDVVPGRYDLLASRTDSSNPRRASMATAPVEVGESDVEGVEIRFHPPFTLSGRIRTEGARGSGKGAPGKLTVSAAPTDPKSIMASSGVPVAEDGTFEIGIQIPAIYRLQIFGDLGRFYVATIRTSASVDVTEEIDLTAGAPVTVVITLRADAARVAIQRQQTEEESPCEPYRFVLWQPGRISGTRVVRAGIFDSAGRAYLDSVPPGEYQIAGVCSGDGSFLQDPDALEWLFANAGKIRVQPNEQKTVTVKDVPLP